MKGMSPFIQCSEFDELLTRDRSLEEYSSKEEYVLDGLKKLVNERRRCVPRENEDECLSALLFEEEVT